MRKTVICLLSWSVKVNMTKMSEPKWSKIWPIYCNSAPRQRLTNSGVEIHTLALRCRRLVFYV